MTETAPSGNKLEAKVSKAMHDDLLHRLSVLRGWANSLSAELLKLEADVREREASRIIQSITGET